MTVRLHRFVIVVWAATVLFSSALAGQPGSAGSDVPRIGYIGLRPPSEGDYLLEVRTADNDPPVIQG